MVGMSDQPKVFYGWVVVATAALGLFLGAFPIVAFSFGVFFQSFVREFHASRAAVSLAFTIHNLLSGIFAVVVGRIADRSGARNVILPGLVVVATLLLAAEAIGSRLSELYLFYAALGVVAPATTTVPYALVVSRWFDRRQRTRTRRNDGGPGPRGGRDADRGATVDRQLRLAKRFCDRRLRNVDDTSADRRHLSQRCACADGTAARRSISRTIPRVSRNGQPVGWRRVARARQSGTFWLLIAVFVLLAASVHACVIHMPQLFADRGATAENAAMASSVVGLALLVGRIGCGYFLDRYFGGRVALVICLGAALGIALLWTGGAGGVALAARFWSDLGMGAEVDIIAFLMSRYFGLRSLGATVGFAFAAFVIAGGLGPLVMGFAFDRTGSYRVPLAAFWRAPQSRSNARDSLGPYRFGAPPGDDAAAAWRPAERPSEGFDECARSDTANAACVTANDGRPRRPSGAVRGGGAGNCRPAECR